MARKAKKAEVPQIVQSAVRLNISVDFPVTDPSEVTDIFALAKDTDLYKLVNEYCYDVRKITPSLVTITTPISQEVA